MDSARPMEFVVEDGLAGERLDRALATFTPELGLRGRRRLIEGGRVLVENRPAAPGLKLRSGQRITLLPEDAGPNSASADVHPVCAAASTADAPHVPIIARTPGYAALNKPAGLHSAALAGGGGPNLEAMLPTLFPGGQARLLNRLDQLTSGIVLVALTPGAARVFATRGAAVVVKEYLAVVQGELDEPLTLKRRLDTVDRKRTRVLGRLENEARNWTLVWPQARLAGARTLVRVRIQAGARHQIRAHLAAANLPIVGDPLYGDPQYVAEGATIEPDTTGDVEMTGVRAASGRLYLHHHLLEFPGFRAQCDPPWLAGLERLPRQSGETAVGETADKEEG